MCKSTAITHKKKQIQNFPIFKNLNRRINTSLDVLNSSLAQLAGELKWWKVMQKSGSGVILKYKHTCSQCGKGDA